MNFIKKDLLIDTYETYISVIDNGKGNKGCSLDGLAPFSQTNYTSKQLLLSFMNFEFYG